MQIRRVLIIVCILVFLLLLIGIYFHKQSPSTLESISKPTSKHEPLSYNEPTNNDIHETHNIEPNHTQFYHPAKPKDIWVSLYDKRLVIRRLAYYDNRDHTHPVIMFNSMYDLRKPEKPNVYVHLNYDDTKQSKCLQLEYKIQSGNLIMAQSEIYVYFLLSTKEPVQVSPSTVSLTTDPNCTVFNDTNIPVRGLVPSKGKDMLMYGVCLHKALFTIKEPQVLIDWVELNKALGAQLLTIYFQDMPRHMYDILLPYINSGLVEVIDWSLKGPSIPSDIYTWDNGMSGVINECIYRNMNRVKYLGLHDIDEYIVPEMNFKTVPQMLTHLEYIARSQPVSAYQFHNTYYFIDNKTVPQVKGYTPPCKAMSLPRYFARTQRATHAETYGSDKLLVKTEAVNVVQVHYVVSARKGYTPVLSVPNEIGRSNHYRWPYRMESFTPHEYSDIMGRYVNEVLHNIERIVCKK